MTTILILGGHDEAAYVVRKAHEMGYEAAVLCPRGDEPAAREADHWIEGDAYDYRSAWRAALDSKVVAHGVMCGCIDSPLAVATVAGALGLPHLPYATAEVFADKLLMADCAPDCFPLTRPSDRSGPPLFGPMVVKPRDSRGARGVSILTGPDGYWAALDRAVKASPTGRAVVQSYIRGPQCSTEGIMIGDTYWHVATADRYYPDRASTLEHGGELPSKLDHLTQCTIVELVARAARLLGARDCIIKGDVVVDEQTGRPYLCEIACRLSGGYFSTYQIPLSTGVDLVALAIQQALGLPVEPPARVLDRPVAKRIVFAGKAGTLGSVTVGNDYRGLRNVVQHEAQHKTIQHVWPGGHVTPMTPIMTMIAEGENAARRAQAAADRVNVEVK